TVPQTHAANQTINISSGKVLGGTSSVNGLVWVRGNKEEYDAIEALGNKGWDWDLFYAAMKQSEAFKMPSAVQVEELGFTVNPSSLGTSGPVEVSFPNYLPLQHQKFIAASKQLGHEFNSDPYSGDNRGIFYINPIVSRTNLFVLYDGALVTKFDTTMSPGPGTVAPQLAEATAVEVCFPDNTVQLAKPKSSIGEIILCAGSIRTPQILELSGIGDKNVLSPLGIETKVDLPGVGANYEDHVITILTFKLKEPYLSFDALAYDPAVKAEQEALYKEGKGWLAFANCVFNMVPTDKILAPEEISVAEEILKTKPPTIHEDLYNSIKDQVFTVPQAEYLL
ncbi:hypothetical protein H0H81_005592, partial [Sphagnurus paluster]